MTHQTTGASREPHGDRDRDEIARLLPAPADRDLPREQHLRHKELLMNEIDRDQDRDQKAATRTRRTPRAALLVPAAGLALAGVLAGGLVLTDDDGGPAAAGPDVRPAAALLDQVSAAAAERPEPTVRDDQFVYTREKTRSADLTSGKAVVGPLVDRETWVTQEPGPVKETAFVREDGEEFPVMELGETGGGEGVVEMGPAESGPAGIGRPTYRWLDSLPTDPDELLDFLYAETPRTDRQERDQEVFEQIETLLGGVTPPRTAAALYQAAAKVPGVTAAPDARDAIGRGGLGIAREDKRYGTRTEWVFDERDYSFLGSRSYLTEDAPYGKAGTLMYGEAELEVGVADESGEKPAEPERTGTGPRARTES